MIRFVALFFAMFVAGWFLPGVHHVGGAAGMAVRRAITSQCRLYGKTFVRGSRKHFKSERQSHEWLKVELARDRAKAEVPVNRLLNLRHKEKWSDRRRAEKWNTLGKAFEKTKAN